MSTETTAEVITITRDGKPPLRFTGSEIASASNRSHQGERKNRWTILTLYKTRGRKCVIKRVHRSQWVGESDRTAAHAFDTAAEVVEWLTEDSGGELGGVSQELLELAAKVDPAFAAAYVEEVE